jgi:hypothetical protein
MNNQVIHRLNSKKFRPQNGPEALIGFVHAALVENGFFIITEQASDVPGFAPSIRGKLVVRCYLLVERLIS